MNEKTERTIELTKPFKYTNDLGNGCTVNTGKRFVVVSEHRGVVEIMLPEKSGRTPITGGFKFITNKPKLIDENVVLEESELKKETSIKTK